MGGAIAYHLTAFLAFVDKHEAVLGIGLGAYGAKYAATGVGSVARIYIHVKRAEAKRAMVSRGEAEGQDFFTAIFTYKTRVVF